MTWSQYLFSIIRKANRRSKIVTVTHKESNYQSFAKKRDLPSKVIFNANFIVILSNYSLNSIKWTKISKSIYS